MINDRPTHQNWQTCEEMRVLKRIDRISIKIATEKEKWTLNQLGREMLSIKGLIDKEMLLSQLKDSLQSEAAQDIVRRDDL